MSEVLAPYAMDPPVFDDDNMEVVSDTAGMYDNPDDIDIDIDLIQEAAEQDDDVIVEDASVTASDRLDMVDDAQEPPRDADMADGVPQEQTGGHPQLPDAEYQFVNDTFDHDQQSFEMEEDYEEDIDAPIPGTSIIEPGSAAAQQQPEVLGEPSPTAQQDTKESPIEAHEKHLKSEPEELPLPKTEDVESLKGKTTGLTDVQDTKDATKQENQQPEELKSPTRSHPDQPEPHAPSIHDTEEADAVTQKTTENTDQLAEPIDVKVLYQGSEISLFPPKEDDPSDTFFLEDEALAREPISHLLDACRAVLADHITEEEELSIEVESLNLHLTESSAQYASFSLSQVVQVYLNFAHNEDIKHPEPLYISISTKPTPDAIFNDLEEAARSGKGLSEINEWEEAEDILEEDEASEAQYLEGDIESVDERRAHDEGGEQDHENEREQTSDHVDEHDEGEQQEQDYHQVDDQGGEEQQEQLDATVSVVEEVGGEHTTTEAFHDTEQPAEENWEGDEEEYERSDGSLAAEDDGNNSQLVASPNLTDNEADKKQSHDGLEPAITAENEMGYREDVDTNQLMASEEAGNSLGKDDSSVTIGGSKDVSASPTIAEEHHTPADEASETVAQPPAVDSTEQGIVQENTDGGIPEAKGDLYEASIQDSPTHSEYQVVDETYSAIDDGIPVANDTSGFKPVTEASTAQNETKQHDTGLTYDDENFEIDLTDPNAAESNNQVTDNANTGQEDELVGFAGATGHDYSVADDNEAAAVDMQTLTGTPEPTHNLFEIDEGLFRSPEAKAQNHVVAVKDPQSSFPEGSRIPVVDSSREPTPEGGIFNGSNEEFYEVTGEELDIPDQIYNGDVFQEESPNHSKRPRAEDEPGALNESVPVTKRRRSE